jgi:hypothetical protein
MRIAVRHNREGRIPAWNLVHQERMSQPKGPETAVFVASEGEWGRRFELIEPTGSAGRG